jgi:ABC-type amino acid transport substrate-binding protein
MGERPRWVGDAITAIAIAALFGVVYLLPPDTSLAEMQKSGRLRICVPALFPPLVTGVQNTPGFDIELAQTIAERMGVRLIVNSNAAMGRDFNPRNWNVTRSQCEVLAGGVIVSDLTRSFLDTTPPYLETGWALVATGILDRLRDRKVGFYGGLAGLDRIALSRFLQSQKARVEIMPSAEALTGALRAGRLDAGVTEALTARQIAGTIEAQVSWLPLGRYPVAMGLWKGDLTLKRRMTGIIEKLENEGWPGELARRYKIAPIKATLRLD